MGYEYNEKIFLAHPPSISHGAPVKFGSLLPSIEIRICLYYQPTNNPVALTYNVYITIYMHMVI
jgi:hypothetical protein